MNPFIKIAFIIGLIVSFALDLSAQKTIDLLPDEQWYGGQIGKADLMPFPVGFEADLNENMGGQVQPLLLSNKGRYIWSERPFTFTVSEDNILVNESVGLISGQSGSTLAEAYNYAAENFLVFGGQTPDNAFFTGAVYHTNITLDHDFNQESILAYALNIRNNGFPGGVIVIDDGWQMDYGDWNFNSTKFSDPSLMVTELHKMGFKVMLYVSPFVSPDSEAFNKLKKSDNAFLSDAFDPEEIKIARWSNGYSAILDLSRATVKIWFQDELERLKSEYGVDGFHFAEGDFSIYEDALSDESSLPTDLANAYNTLGLKHRVNLYSSTWKMGGYPIVQKASSSTLDWKSLTSMINTATLQGIMGYPFQVSGVLSANPTNLDKEDPEYQELMVRALQVQAMMPIMNFSLAPWNSLDEKHLSACVAATNLREENAKYLIKLAGLAATRGIPMIQSMEFVYPRGADEEPLYQFMLGADMVVAPVVKYGERKKEVFLPAGIWLGKGNRAYQGPTTLTVNAPLNEIPYFRRAVTK